MKVIATNFTEIGYKRMSCGDIFLSSYEACLITAFIQISRFTSFSVLYIQLLACIKEAISYVLDFAKSVIT